MTTLSLSLFGSFYITLGRQIIGGFKSDKVRALLAYLIVEADRPHRREALAALLWPDMPDRSARSNLRDALANLRQVIGDPEADPPFLLIERNTIQFNTSSDYCFDIGIFCEQIESYLDDQPAYQELAEAVGLYRGDFLDGFSLKDSPAFNEWCLLTRERLQRQAVRALGELAGYHEKLGQYAQACTYARRRIELEPWEEDSHRQLMRALALDGQRGAALSHYESCRQLLVEELGVEPAEETTRLVEHILLGSFTAPSQDQSDADMADRKPRLVGDCPYRGLTAFREKDTEFFFGREDFASKLHQAVHSHPMVTVIVGSSGSGKSSVIAAGLLPLLRDEGYWLIAPFRPGAQPFDALAGVLQPILEPDLNATDSMLEIKKLSKALYNGDLVLQQVVESILDKQYGKKRLLLVADQFEELYTLCQEQETRRRFLDDILGAVESGRKYTPPRFVILLSLRADFMGYALSHRRLADILQDVSLMLGPMTRDEMQAAIEMPAQKQGAAFEAGLVHRLLDDVGEEPGKLPLLEFALTLLWEQADEGWLTHAAYESIGKVDGALTRYADQVYGELDGSDRQRARRIFVQLVRPGEGTQDTRRVATSSELGDELWDLVQHLANRRLVVTGQDASGDETVEVVHEALIQRWGRLRGWMDADRAFRTWQEGLRAALRQWELSNNDEGALLRGVPLSQAEDWLAERRNELSLAELTFIQVSVALRERRQAERDRRRRRTVLGLAGGLVIAVVLAIFAFWARASAQREAAVNHSLVLASSALSARDKGELDLALALALEAVDIEQPPAEAVRTLSETAMGPGTRAVLSGHSKQVRAVAISPDGRLALSGSCGALDSSGECIRGELFPWDLESEAQLGRYEGHTGWVNSIAFSPDGERAISGSSDGKVILWDVKPGRLIRQFEGHAGGVNSVAFNPDGEMALSGSDDNTLILWDLASGEAIRRFEGHTDGVNSVDFSSDGQTALSGSKDTSIILWNVATGEEIRRFEGHINEVTDVAFALDGRAVLSAGDHTLRLWDLETGQEIRQQHYGNPPKLYAVSSDRHTALFTMGALRVWDIEGWRESQAALGSDLFLTHEGWATSAAFSRDGHLALSGSEGGELRLWTLGVQTAFRRFETDGNPLAALAVSSDGSRLLTGDMSDTVALWDGQRREVIRRLQGDAVAVSPNSIAFSPDGKQALVGSGDAFGGTDARSLVLWDLETGQVIHRLEGHKFILRSVAISPDGRFALSGSQGGDEGELILWDLETGEQIRRFDTTEDITSIAFSADGSRALTGSAFFYNATLWDVATGQEITRFEGETNMVFDVAFGPDEKTALSTSADGSLFQWDLQTGEIIRRFLGHDDLVWSVDVSPDGNFVISGAQDGEVILWDLATGEALRRFSGHTELVPGVVFSPDGRTAYSVSLDGELIEWQVSDLSLDELIQWSYTNRYVRELTCEERVQYRVEPLCTALIQPPAERDTKPGG
ncbi:MAG: BTAD domain-containing putative transcriptional regulator [Anaerolineales bacterium]